MKVIICIIFLFISFNANAQLDNFLNKIESEFKKILQSTKENMPPDSSNEKSSGILPKNINEISDPEPTQNLNNEKNLTIPKDTSKFRTIESFEDQYDYINYIKGFNKAEEIILYYIFLINYQKDEFKKYKGFSGEQSKNELLKRNFPYYAYLHKTLRENIFEDQPFKKSLPICKERVEGVPTDGGVIRQETNGSENPYQKECYFNGVSDNNRTHNREGALINSRKEGIWISYPTTPFIGTQPAVLTEFLKDTVIREIHADQGSEKSKKRQESIERSLENKKRQEERKERASTQWTPAHMKFLECLYDGGSRKSCKDRFGDAQTYYQECLFERNSKQVCIDRFGDQSNAGRIGTSP